MLLSKISFIKTFFLFFASVASLFLIQVFAQNNRINTYENVGWYNTFVTAKLPNNLGIHGEYQWRRVDYGDKWQQGLLRTGINFNINTRVQLRLGYAWIETFNYGEYPLNSLGKNFTEHRVFQMVQLFHVEGKVNIIHRFKLEQRFVGRYTSSDLDKEDEYRYMGRVRYMLRLQMPLIGTEIRDKTPYLAAYDELFIGFGKNVNANVFDQNRAAFLLGYRFNKTLRLEAGYFNQILQLSRQIEGKNVYQHNDGFIVNAYLGLDFSEKKGN